MSRQTAFPGIIVDRIEAKTSSQGREVNFEEGLPENISSERIQSLIDQVPLFGSGFTDSLLRYHLEVAAPAEVVAKGKSKMFTRIKNPFSGGLIKVVDTELLEPNIGAGARNAYRVVVEVEK